MTECIARRTISILCIWLWFHHTSFRRRGPTIFHEIKSNLKCFMHFHDVLVLHCGPGRSIPNSVESRFSVAYAAPSLGAAALHWPVSSVGPTSVGRLPPAALPAQQVAKRCAVREQSAGAWGSLEAPIRGARVVVQASQEGGKNMTTFNHSHQQQNVQKQS